MTAVNLMMMVALQDLMPRTLTAVDLMMMVALQDLMMCTPTTLLIAMAEMVLWSMVVMVFFEASIT